MPCCARMSDRRDIEDGADESSDPEVVDEVDDEQPERRGRGGRSWPAGAAPHRRAAGRSAASIQPSPLIAPTIGISWIRPMIKILFSHSGSRNGQTNASVTRSNRGLEVGGGRGDRQRGRSTSQTRVTMAPTAVATMPRIRPALAGAAAARASLGRVDARDRRLAEEVRDRARARARAARAARPEDEPEDRPQERGHRRCAVGARPRALRGGGIARRR